MLKRQSKIPAAFAITLIAIGSMFVSSCQKKIEPGKSIEQIRAEDGVPIRIKQIDINEFDKNLTFFATLSGVKETIQKSILADKIVKIRAKVGDNVREGQSIVEFPKDNPTIQFDQAKLAYDNSKKTYERMKELLKAGETSQQNFDNAETQYLVNKRNWESLHKMIYIESPFSGTIVNMKVKEGDQVGGNQDLFTVAVMNKVIAKVWVTATEVAYIRNGMTATMKINGKEYTGKVSLVSLGMDMEKRAFAVEITFDNAKRELKSGMTSDIKINAYRNSKAIMVPRNVIVKDGDNKYIFVENNGKVERRVIETGLESGINVEVTKGIQAGDKVVIEGIALLRDGIKVKVIQ